MREDVQNLAESEMMMYKDTHYLTPIESNKNRANGILGNDNRNLVLMNYKHEGKESTNESDHSENTPNAIMRKKSGLEITQIDS
jgi:hypothetical protein